MQTCYEQTFPLRQEEQLRSISLLMPNAQDIDAVTYHVNRYGKEGLYGTHDPAERSLRGELVPFKEKYPELAHPGTSLVIVSRNTTENREGEQ